MFKKVLLLPLLLALFSLGLQAQDQTPLDKLKADKADKEAKIAALQGEVDAIKGEIATYPGWKFGALGTLGVNFAQFNDWLSTETPNTFSSSYGFSGSAFARLDQDKYFWRNSGNLVLAKTKLDTNTQDSIETSYESTSDAFNITSLFGYKLNDKWAASALAEYRTTFLSNFNNPAYLDVGVGATWTPIPALVVVFHPLNYNIVIADTDLSYESSLGCKIVADYAQSLPMGVSWKSNLSAFVSYKDPNNFSNWTWVNGFGLTVWKGIGVGFEFGLRGNKQESYNTALTNPDNAQLKIEDLPSDSNPLQNYWLLGLTYNL